MRLGLPVLGIPSPPPPPASGGGGFQPSLDFSDARNSQYIPVFA